MNPLPIIARGRAFLSALILVLFLAGTWGSAQDVVTTMTFSHPAQLEEEDTVNILVRIENLSPTQPDTNIQFVDAVAPGVSNFSMASLPSAGLWTWDDAAPPNGKLVFDLDQLAPGQSVDFAYDVRIDLTCKIDYYKWCNQGFTTSTWISSNEPAPRGSIPGGEIMEAPTCTGNIRAMGHRFATASKTVITPPPEKPGDPVTYQITFVNPGPCTALNGRVEDHVPAELTDFDPVNGVDMDPPDPDVWNVCRGPGWGDFGRGRMSFQHFEVPGNGGILTFTMTAKLGNVPPGTEICNTGWSLFPGEFSTDTNTVCQTVGSVLDVEATKRFEAPNDPILQGDVVTYEITITNISPSFDVWDGEFTDDISPDVAFDVAAAEIQIVDDPGADAQDVSQGPPAGAYGNGRVRIANIDLPAGGSTFRMTYKVTADTVAGPPGVCNDGTFVVSGQGVPTEEVCFQVEPSALVLPGAISDLLLYKRDDDVVVERWNPDANAASYSIYGVVSSPSDGAMIGEANAQGAAMFPDDIALLCGEVPLAPLACVHEGGVSVAPGCIFYQVVGVATNGEEGPN